MSNLTKGQPLQPVGGPVRRSILPIKATSQLWESAMVAEINGALCTGTTPGSGHCVGVVSHDALGGATDGASRAEVLWDRPFRIAAGVNAPTDATPVGTVLYMEDDNHVGTLGTQIAGRFLGFEDDGYVRVFIGPLASWFDSYATPFRCRAVVTTLQAYTGSTTGILTETSNGAISAADGVTLAAGDVVFLEEGTTNLTAASDAGPYVVVSLGGAGSQWILARPGWWSTGQAMPQGVVMEIGGEGTLKGGTSWKSFAAKGTVIDTGAPLFWAREVLQSVTLTAGTVTISNVGIRSATKTVVEIARTATGGTVSSTVQYCPTVAGATGLTQGAINTGSVVIQATVAAGTIANADTSTLAVAVQNW